MINKVLELREIMKDVHRQLLMTPQNLETKAEIDNLHKSLKTTKDTVVVMEAAYAEHAKALARA